MIDNPKIKVSVKAIIAPSGETIGSCASTIEEKELLFILNRHTHTASTITLNIDDKAAYIIDWETIEAILSLAK